MNFINLSHILTDAECKIILAMLQSAEWEEMGDEKYKHFRYDMKAPQLSNLVLERIIGYVPCKPNTSYYVHPEWYISKYTTGCSMDVHADGKNYYERDQSLYTLLIYLNQDFEGGQTVCYIKTKDKKLIINDIICPHIGKGILLSQSLLHEGKPIEKGTKYVLRSDLMVHRELEDSSK